MKIPSLLLFFISLGLFAQERTYSSEKELGDGFIKRNFTVKMPPEHWESIGHFSSVFYHDVELGQLDMLSISPNKVYSSYVKANDGKLYIFNLINKKANVVIHAQYCFPYATTWLKDEVNLQCYGSKNTEYALSVNLSNLPYKARVVK